MKYIAILLFIGKVVLQAQENGESQDSFNQEKRNTLRYGIDSEVLELIGTIRSEEDQSFNQDLLQLLGENRSNDIRKAIFDLFGMFGISDAEEAGATILNNYLEEGNYPTSLLLSVISYLGEVGYPQGGLFYDLVTSSNPLVAEGAMRNIGKLGDASRFDEVVRLLEKYEGDRSFQDFVGVAILAIGELKYLEAQDYLKRVLGDEFSPASHRQFAALSLGKLNQPEGLQVLQEMYNSSEENLLRTYILQGISEYDDPTVEEMMIVALRDSFWRIREAAAKGLGERKVGAATDILTYKVKKDPVTQVRYASLRSLAQIGDPTAHGFILAQFKDEQVAFDLRQQALTLMVEFQIPGSIPAIQEVLEPKWEKANDPALGAFCKTLSTSQWAELQPLFDRMLENRDYIIKLYGIRGARLNQLGGLKGKVQALDQDGVHRSVRREVQSALESF